MASFKIDLSRLKALPKRLKVVGIILAAELAILASGYLILDDAMADRVSEVSTLRGDLQQAKRQNEQYKTDLARYPEIRKEYDEALAVGITVPFDGRNVIGAAKALGERYRLSNVQFKLGPMDGMKNVSTPRIVVENDDAEFKFDALLDGDVRSFWRDLAASAPGHFRVRSFEIERQHDVDEATLLQLRQGTYPALLQARLDLLWTGVRPNLQGGGS